MRVLFCEEDNHQQKKNQEMNLGIKLLVAEDDPNMGTILKVYLTQKGYTVFLATDGQQALDIYKESNVDACILDVMMPVKDGFTVAKELRRIDKNIPILFLTAKSMEADKLKGFEIGADDYITKPFSMDILRQRIHNLMERSRQQHERFAKEIDIEPSEITVTSLDEKFIARAIEIVEAHISEPDFKIEQLSEEMGVHRAQLYKKLHHLTGKTPQQFVRIIRLKRGKQLLEQSGLYVSEVAYQVGFNSPRIFSKYFKEEFGVTPKGYTKQE